MFYEYITKSTIFTRSMHSRHMYNEPTNRLTCAVFKSLQIYMKGKQNCKTTVKKSVQESTTFRKSLKQHLMNAKQAQCNNMSTPCSTTGTAAGTASNVSPIKHQSHVVGTFSAAAITRCGQDSSISMGH